MQKEFASFRTRLLWLMLLFAVGFGGFATILYRQAKGAFLETLEGELRGDAHWLSLQLPAANGSGSYGADSVCRVASKAKGYRFTVVDPDGKVIADSHIDRDQLDTLDNHNSRPEIQDARKSGSGSELRYSLTTRMDMLYYAQKLPGTDTVVRVSASSAVIEKFSLAALRTFAGFAFLFLALAVSVLWWTHYAISAPLLRLSLDAHDPQKPLRWNAPFREADVLNRAFEAYVDLIRRLGSRTQRERDRLAGVVDRLEEGVLLYDGSGFVRLANGSAYRLLLGRSEGGSWEGRRLEDVLDEASLLAFTAPDAREGLPPVLLLDKRAGAPYDLICHFRELHPGEKDEPLPSREFLLTLANITEFRSLDRSKSEFVANASHELKTPLASIRGYSESLLEGAMENANLRKSFVEKIHNNALRLQELVGDLLSLSKLEAGETARSEPLPVRAYVVSALQRQRSLVDSQGLRVEVLVPEAVQWDMEPRDLELILDNLIGNAVKYNRPAGKIRVSWEEGARLVVKDTGSGIPPDILPHIFERFFRGDAARRHEGTGLGLAIVKHAANKYGFKVWAESQVGEGSRFVVEVASRRPAASQPEPAAAAAV